MDSLIDNYTQFWPFLTSRLGKNAGQKHEGLKGIALMKAFLATLGNPQEKIPTIHIAGTAGKGSTAYYIAGLLVKHGFKVGLTVSPHVLDVRERFQIDLKYPSETAIVKCFRQFQTELFDFEAKHQVCLNYHKLNIAFAYYFFAQQALDYIVMETGIGGLYDSTNVIKNPSKISVITHIGFDHMELLGNTLTEIATQKAGILLPNSQAFSAPQTKEIEQVLEKVAKEKNVSVFFTIDLVNYSLSHKSFDNASFDYSCGSLNVQNISLPLSGPHQIENAVLALATVQKLAERDKFTLSTQKIKAAFAKTSLPGRMQLIQQGKVTIILDGAHNHDKIAATVETLKTTYPDRKFRIIFANTDHHKPNETLPQLLPLASEITITNTNSFADLLPPELLTKRLKKAQQLKLEIEKIIPVKKLIFNADPLKSLTEAIERSKKETNPTPILVTGSFYLVSTILVNFQFDIGTTTISTN